MSGSLRLLHIANTAGLDSGGIGEVVHGLLRAQRNRGSDVRLWFPGTDRMASQVCSITGLDSQRVRAIRHVRLLGNVVPYGLLSPRENGVTCDVLHQHGIWVPNSLFVARMAARGVRTIINPHGLLEPKSLRMSAAKKRITAWLYEHRNLHRASCLVACSDQEAVGIREYGLKQPIAIIPNGVADEFFATPAPDDSERVQFRARHSLPLNSRILLFLSRVHPFKGLDLLIDAVNAIREEMARNRWILVIAGPSELGHRDELEKRVARHGLQDIVRFLPALHNTDKLVAFHDASFFVLPSINENFGIVVAEALACGVPVAASQGTPWRSLQAQGCGFWVKRTHEDFENCLRTVIRMSDGERSAMGQRGRLLAEERFRWASVATQFDELYDWVRGMRSRPSFVHVN